MNPLSTVDGDNGDMLLDSQIVLTVISIVSHLHTTNILNFLYRFYFQYPDLSAGSTPLLRRHARLPTNNTDDDRQPPKTAGRIHFRPGSTAFPRHVWIITASIQLWRVCVRRGVVWTACADLDHRGAINGHVADNLMTSGRTQFHHNQNLRLKILLI